MNFFQKALRRLQIKHIEVARRLKVARPSITAWVNGGRRVPDEYILPFAKILEIDPHLIREWNIQFEGITRRQRMDLERRTAHRRYAKISRNEVDDAVNRYLASGGTIKKIEPGPETTELEKLIEDIGGLAR